MRNREDVDVVFFIEEGVLGLVLERKASMSNVRYFANGIEYEGWVDNNDFCEIEEIYDDD